MSASLVGSEMCIRDRSSRPSRGFPAAVHPPQAAGLTQKWQRRGRLCSDCLLYTSDAADDM
eukprot:10588840-Alexandrium_andersonii.AAC.1